MQSFLTLGGGDSSVHNSQHNGEDSAPRQSDDDSSAGWALSRLWRRGEPPTSGGGADDVEGAADGFAGVLSTSSAGVQQPRSRTVFLPNAPVDLKIKIQRCAALRSGVQAPHAWPSARIGCMHGRPWAPTGCMHAASGRRTQ
jgi:hypothetical protein